jgi:hypothetical protein
MKKPKTYNLHRSVYEAINKLALADGRSDSDWLNIHLGNTLLTKEVVSVKKPSSELVIKEPLLLPIELNQDAWFKWLEFRKVAKFKKYKTGAQMNKLAKMGTHKEQALIVQCSIDNEYQGLFALKKDNSNKDILKDSADSDWHLQDQGF